MSKDLIPTIDTYKEEGIEFTKITNNVGLSVTFSNYGAAIFSINYLGEEMTFGPKDVKDFLREDVYNGKAIGRVAGRIKGDTIKIGNKSYKLYPNEGKNVLHGGKGALSSKYFSTRIFSTQEHVHVVYTYFSTSLESGFPGNALFEVHYIVHNDIPRVKVKLLSYVTEKGPVSMTSHTYFSLGESNLDNLSLQINASKYLEINPEDLLLGKMSDVPSYLDFRSMKPIMKDINAPELNKGKLNGYDHSFVLDKVTEEIPQVVVEGPKFKVDIYTDFDSVVIYTDNLDQKFVASNSKDKIRRGIAVEPQPCQGFQHYLSRGDEFDHYIRYEFSKK